MAKSVTDDSHFAEGTAVLEQWGITASAIRDGSVPVSALEEVVGRSADADRTLAWLLGSAASTAFGEFLVKWEGTAKEKRLRKEISRSLYRLAQRGIKTERSQKSRTKKILAPIEPEGYLSPMDGKGDRLVWLTKPRLGGGLQFLSSLVNEPLGMRYIEGTEVTRKVLRQARRDLSENNKISMIEADWRYCDFIMHEGYERSRAEGKTEVDSYLAARSHVVTTAPTPSRVPLPEGMEVDSNASREADLADSLLLTEEPEIQRWLFDAEQARPYLEKINSAQDSPLVLNQHQKQERVNEVIKDAVVELFSGQSGESYSRRFEETAMYFASTARPVSARRALTVSLALRSEGNSGQDIPLCEGLVRQSISLHYKEEKQQEQEEAKGSLIMKPSDFAAQGGRGRRS